MRTPTGLVGSLALTVVLAAAFCGGVAAAPSAAPRITLPGLKPVPPELGKQLWAAWEAAGKPLQSRHRRSDGAPLYLNRLMLESNPYLQLHAQNPVDWFAWGRDAFEKAKREGKPVLLSIGYASCHWCLLMAEESYDDVSIAELINRKFVAIKVDRDDRPDVDAAYNTAVRHLAGRSGWPLIVFLTPSGDPFYGGTYFPPEQRDGRPGLKEVLRTVADTWERQRASALEAAAAVRSALTAKQPKPAEIEKETVLRRAAVHLAKLFDSKNGGFGQPPKFPQPHILQFLLRYGQRFGDSAAVGMVKLTLDRMARGSIDDLLGGGFHRYSKDAAWLMPDFEKTVYDQAGLAMAYLEASRFRQSIEEVSTAADIFRYLLTELQLPGGGFAVGQSARNGGQEGAYYLWTRDDVIRALGPTDGAWVADFFGLAEASSHPRPLHIPVPVEEFVRARGMGREDFVRKITQARAALLAVRAQRPRPAIDAKIVTAWNGWMIAALAEGAMQLDNAEYLAAARRAATRLLTDLYAEGTLWRSWYQGKRSVPGFLDDYAFLAYGLHRLYEATGEIGWLREGDRILTEMLHRFDDPSTGNLRYTQTNLDPVVPPVWALEDAALPSAQSVAALALLRMGHLLQRKEYWQRAEVLLRANGEDLQTAPTAYAFLLQAIDFALGPRAEIVIVGKNDAQGTRELRKAAARQFLPRALVVSYQAGDESAEHLLSYAKGLKAKDGKPTAYVCQNFSCKSPVTEVPAFLEQLSVLQAPVPTPGKQPEPRPLSDR